MMWSSILLRSRFGVSGSAHTLQQDSESSRGTDMANDVDVADIDAELE